MGVPASTDAKSPASPASEPADTRSRRPKRPRAANLNLRISAILVVILVLAGTLIFELDTTHKASPASNPNSGAEAALPTPIRHVIILMMEDQGVSDVLAYGPYERYLAENYAFASQYYGLSSDSLKNYEYAVSGTSTAVALPGNSTATPISSLIDEKNLTWVEYAESMPMPCDLNDTYAIGNPNVTIYDTDHIPFIHFRVVSGNLTTAPTTYCTAHVLPLNLTQWNASVAANDLPNYVWVTPNDLDDDHECVPANASYCIPHGDTWLRDFLGPLINSSSFSDSAIFLTWDFNATENSVQEAHIYTAVISPYARLHYSSNVHYTAYNLLSTSEWLLGLGHTNEFNNFTTYSPMEDMFDFWPSYNVTGNVMVNGTSAAGAVVSGGGYSVTTDPSGSFELSLSKGVQGFTASVDNGTCTSPVQSIDVTGPGLVLNFQLSC